MAAGELAAAGAATHGATPRPLGSRLLSHVRVPLHRDGYALVLNSAFTAATGVVYWIVAAKLYSPHALGLNSALVSSMMFLAGLAGLNLVNVLVRFLPEAGRRTRSFIAGSYAVTGTLAALAALVFVVGADEWSSKLGFLESSPALSVWFVLSSAVWCVFAIQDSVLTALGRAVWVPVENAIFSLLKLVVLASCAAFLPVYGIFVSWTAAMLVSVVGVSAVIFTRLARAGAHAGAPASFTSRAARPQLKRYLALDYLGSLAWLTSSTLVPVIVTAVAGATTNAYYALAWAVALPMYSISGSIGTSLVLHGTRDRTALPTLTRRAFVQGAAVLIPAVVVVELLAPTALSLFGHSYSVHGAAVLRLLALAALPNFVLTLVLSVARVERRLGGIVIVLALQAALLLGLVAPLLDALGATGVGVAWVVSESVAAAVVLAAAVLGLLRLPLLGGVRPQRRREPRGGNTRRVAAELASECSARPLVASTMRALKTDSDVAAFLVEAPFEDRLVVKLALSPTGAGALAAHRSALRELRGTPGVTSWTALVPEVVASGTKDGHDYVVERALPGVDARRFARGARTEAALTATARGLRTLYDVTSSDRVVDGWMLERLVHEPVDQVAGISLRSRPRAVERLHTELAEVLTRGAVPVGRVHGDLWLGNALVAPNASALTGLVDWEASRDAGLPAADLMHLVVTTRALRGRRQLGAVVRALVRGSDRLTERELDLLEPYMPSGGRSAVRAVVLLAWLEHISLRLRQSARPPQGHWLLRNVEAVLAELEG